MKVIIITNKEQTTNNHHKQTNLHRHRLPVAALLIRFADGDEERVDRILILCTYKKQFDEIAS